MTNQAKQDSTAVQAADRAVLWITCAATVAALGLSYRNQFDFASSHRGGYPLWAAAVFPLMIDSFVVVGELRLFSAVARNEEWRIKAWAWLLTLGGLAASSVAGVAHVGLSGPLSVKLAAAVAPLAAAASLGTGLGIVKLNARRKAPAAGQADTAGPRARQPGKRTKSGQPSAAVVSQWITDDRLAGLPMGRRSFTDRHRAEGLTEHAARVALAVSGNGSGDKVPV